MAVQTINTDIAAEVNITARRNDTFVFKFSVTNPTDTTAGLQMNLGQGTTNTTYPIYQAKMSIVDSSTGDIKLSLYSAHWQNTDGTLSHAAAGTGSTAPLAIKPTATTAGAYSGQSNPASGVLTGGAIDFSANTATLNSLAVVSAPFDYMVFEPGEYKYDLQIREQTTGGTGAGALLTIKYTTWMYGTFTLNPDITRV